MNRQICAEFCGTIMIPSLAHEYMWLFIRRQPTWISLKGLNWEAIIGSDIKRASAGTVFAAQTPSCLRLVSVLASTMMTIVYVLEQLNTRSAWTTKTSLTIHVLGALPEFDPSMVYLYEGILHRIPSVNILNYAQSVLRIGVRDLALLRESGANLLPSLSPAVNPFGSLMMDPNFVDSMPPMPGSRVRFAEAVVLDMNKPLKRDEV
ncbi:hypothetical protein C8R44DRAFT_870522 [Mycena epipterygia]|nr:hypothetical protein C8R44DRAFT_870522 [Mycena epipterygia]